MLKSLIRSQIQTKRLNIKVIGYYNHYNLGDDQYKSSINHLLYTFFRQIINYSIEFVDCDTIHNHQFHPDDIIILGGGDILNPYFINKIYDKFFESPNKIIGLSVGIPYPSFLENCHKLNIIDYIFIRTRQDLDLFSEYFHPSRIYYIPDLSFVFTRRFNRYIDDLNFNSILTDLQTVKALNKQIIAVSLSRHIYHPDHRDHYNHVVRKIAALINFLNNFNFHVVFIPYNTNPDNLNENDIIIHRDVISYLNKESMVTSIEMTLTPFELNTLYNIVDFSIPMRFHACLFSLYRNIPILPIFTTRKIKNLLLDLDWIYGYEMPTNNIGIPTDMQLSVVISRFLQLTKSKTIYNKINSLLKSMHLDFKKSSNKLIELLLNPYSKNEIHTLQQNNINTIHKTQIEETLDCVQKFVQKNGYSDFRMVKDTKIQQKIVSMVSFLLTKKTIDSVYNYGLLVKMFDENVPYDHNSEWKWILNDLYTNHKPIPNNPDGIFNIDFIDQNDYSGVHRSGWQYVYKNLLDYHDSKSSLLLDLYIDRTFHWNLDINKELGIIPYTKPWVGFIHHTFEQTFSDYNCVKLFQCPEFIESLKTCKCLFVLSDYLKNQIGDQLVILNFHIPVFSLVHPTELNVPRFSMKRFIENESKKILHIGGWLRNTYTFYKLDLPERIPISTNCMGWFPSKYTITKAALHGKNMSNYFPSDTFLPDLKGLLTNYSNSNDKINGNCSNGKCCSHDDIQNNWYNFFYRDTKKTVDSVSTIYYAENESYDELLSQNIVFINLIDASAVNTLIECIVRSTPIIVNYHPAVKELLGENYPLYYYPDISVQYQIESLLSKSNIIWQAHEYMKYLNKSLFDIRYFTTKLISIINELK